MNQDSSDLIIIPTLVPNGAGICNKIKGTRPILWNVDAWVQLRAMSFTGRGNGGDCITPTCYISPQLPPERQTRHLPMKLKPCQKSINQRTCNMIFVTLFFLFFFKDGGTAVERSSTESFRTEPLWTESARIL